MPTYSPLRIRGPGRPEMSSLEDLSDIPTEDTGTQARCRRSCSGSPGLCRAIAPDHNPGDYERTAMGRRVGDRSNRFTVEILPPTCAALDRGCVMTND